MRAMIYTRISSDSEGRELGVTRQLEDCTALAERHGWTIVREYRDNDRGASTRSRKPRPEYAAMLDAVRAGEADLIIAYSASRITRRMADWLDLIKLVERTGVKIETVVSGKVDVNTADGRMMLQIMASIDQGEAERTAERIARAHRQRQDEGRPNWTRRPFGHEVDGTEREAEATAIRTAAGMIIDERATLYAIMKKWNTDGLSAVSGAAWSIDTVSRLLRAPRIAGLMPNGTPSPKIAEILAPLARDGRGTG
jgi:site-specific DNA recombinase